MLYKIFLDEVEGIGSRILKDFCLDTVIVVMYNVPIF